MESICSKTIKINENNEKKQFITFIVLKAITPLLNIHCHFPLQGEYRSASFLSVSLNEFSQAEAARKLGRACSVYWVELSSQYCHIVSTRHRSAQKHCYSQEHCVKWNIKHLCLLERLKATFYLQKAKDTTFKKSLLLSKRGKNFKDLFWYKGSSKHIGWIFFTLGTKKM